MSNPLVGVNYLPVITTVETPPHYVLQQFYDFDDQLVLFPSTHVPYAYVIARRLRTRVTDKALMDTIDQPDTKRCLAHGLTPVCLMYRIGTGWNADSAIESLRRRDGWRVEGHDTQGADVVADVADAADAARERRIKKENRDNMWNRSGDAWRSYQARTGQRNKLTVPGTRSERRTVTSSSSGRTAGSGVTITVGPAIDQS